MGLQGNLFLSNCLKLSVFSHLTEKEVAVLKKPALHLSSTEEPINTTACEDPIDCAQEAAMFEYPLVGKNIGSLCLPASPNRVFL